MGHGDGDGYVVLFLVKYDMKWMLMLISGEFPWIFRKWWGNMGKPFQNGLRIRFGILSSLLERRGGWS